MNHVPSLSRVSIGMPVFNGEAHLREAIDSLLKQTCKEFELIISDNASTDSTPEICREYADNDDRITYIRQATNIGVTANFEFVLDLAKNTYFMWAAADDRRDPNFIATLIRILDGEADIVCAMTDVLNFRNDSSETWLDTIAQIRLSNSSLSPTSNRSLFFRNPTSNIFFCVYGLYRIEIIRGISLRYGNLKFVSGSEIPLLAQVACKGCIVSTEGALFHYRRHHESMFHSEQAQSGKYDFILRHFLLSVTLLRIAIRCDLPLREKFRCIASTASSSFHFYIRIFLRVLKMSFTYLFAALKRRIK